MLLYRSFSLFSSLSCIRSGAGNPNDYFAFVALRWLGDWYRRRSWWWYGSGRAAAAFGRYRSKPGAASKLNGPMILGLALIESLVIYAFVIAIMLTLKVSRRGSVTFSVSLQKRLSGGVFFWCLEPAVSPCHMRPD